MLRRMRKLNIWLLTLAMTALLLGPTAAFAADSGDCGEGLTWSLSAGTLTITGSGAMTDFTEPDMAPWYSYREDILRLELPDGLTSVGDLAFYDCKNLTAVVIPDTVEHIGDYAFAKCEGVALLDLGDGLRTVGEASFSDCYDLRALRLPDSLESMDLKAFYRCESITTVTIPASVTEVGVSAFGYCKSLISADIQATLDVLPEYMFYGCERLSTVKLPDTLSDISDFTFSGCDQLSTVYYDGDQKTLDEVEKLMEDNISDFDATGTVAPGAPQGGVSSGGALDNGDGTITQENVTVTEKENVSVSTKVEHTFTEGQPGGGTYDAEIDVTVDGQEGWQQAQDIVNDALTNLDDLLTVDGVSETVDINVYAKGTDSVDQSFVDSLAGRDVNLSVMTQNGSTWRIEGTQLTGSNGGVYDLTYTITAGSQQLCEELGVETCFVLRFDEPAQVNAEVLIPLSQTWAVQEATLFQREKGKLTQHQSVVVDNQGCAHFYLASVSQKTEYYIAMNLPEKESMTITRPVMARISASVMAALAPFLSLKVPRVSLPRVEPISETDVRVAPKVAPRPMTEA